ncbi:MAG: FecR domain-containing protein, partial [Rhodospirillales bacterium]|nr:FecR domain-containing protein [Rhodospirillales bacterium]
MADQILRDAESLTLTPDGAPGGGDGRSVTVGAGGGGEVTLPQNFNFGSANFAQSGSDLILTSSAGDKIVVAGFFDQDPAPILKTPDGGELAGDTAGHLARALSPSLEVAQAAPDTDAQPIGQVESISGTVVAIRANGVRVELQAGDPVFQGDVLQSSADGSVGVVLADETTFSMAQNGRMVLDEMVYDPGTQEGSISMSVLQGVFTFVSGQVAKVDPDAMTLKTPVATIGIRGTQVGLNLSPNGEGTPDLKIVLMEESDGFVGEVVISNGGGVRILNLPDQGSTVTSSNAAPSEPRVFQRSEVRESFGKALESLPTTVGTGNTYGAENDNTPGGEGEGEAGDGETAQAADESTAENFETAAGGENEGGEGEAEDAAAAEAEAAA